MLSASQSLRLYQLVLKHFNNEEDARIFVTEIEETIENKVISGTQLLSTKEDLKSEISQVRLDLQQTKVDLIKWFFAFFVSLALMVLGLYIKK